MNRNTTIRLKKQIRIVEKKKQTELDKRIKEILKTDTTIMELQNELDNLNKLLKTSEEIEKKALALDEKIENFLG